MTGGFAHPGRHPERSEGSRADCRRDAHDSVVRDSSLRSE